MKSKMCVRAVVLAAIFAWPAVLSYQVWEAHQQLAASTKVEQKVTLRLADARAKASTQVARTGEAR
jgi:regulatory protein YycH of two-component signal transduction system YycFG